MNFNHLISMGGYGFYVWTAYSITFIVFLMNIGLMIQEKNQVKKILDRYFNQSS